MSDQGNRPPDEPTRAYTPVNDNDYSTRLERPIEPYTDQQSDVPPTLLPAGYQERRSLAPLITVGLLCVLLGIGLGYLLFHNASSSDDTPATTTSTTAVATTTTASTTSSSTSSSTTSSTSSTTSTTAKPTTTTTAKPTSTTKATTTTTGDSAGTTLP